MRPHTALFAILIPVLMLASATSLKSGSRTDDSKANTAKKSDRPVFTSGERDRESERVLRTYVEAISAPKRHAQRYAGEASRVGPLSGRSVKPASDELSPIIVADGWSTKTTPSATGRSSSSSVTAPSGRKHHPSRLGGVPTTKEKAARGQADELLVPIDEIKRKSSRRSQATAKSDSAREKHLALFVENRYPSANTCAVCHPKHYREWSVSQHAYAQLSPTYLSLNNRINQLSNGSNGDFCFRCHSPVGANLGESPYASNLDRHPTSREGITCVVCHRINKAYNKASGRLALVEGGLTDPIFGPDGNAGVKDVLKRPSKFRVVTDDKSQGRKMHAEARLFQQIKTPVFCGTCHDVTLFNGFRLEEAYSEYRVSPAAAKGITCQDCHMGKIQGKPSGYENGPAAIVGGKPTKARKLTSHLFSGPDYPLVHPGIFPHNERAAAFKTLREWLQFKHEEGWGTAKFENNIPRGY
ncbi:MAG: multiheme c-type cytochrome, partial [Pseudomonadota bacterium]